TLGRRALGVVHAARRALAIPRAMLHAHGPFRTLGGLTTSGAASVGADLAGGALGVVAAALAAPEAREADVTRAAVAVRAASLSAKMDVADLTRVALDVVTASAGTAQLLRLDQPRHAAELVAPALRITRAGVGALRAERVLEARGARLAVVVGLAFTHVAGARVEARGACADERECGEETPDLPALL